MHIAHYWVLQGNPEKQWDRPALLYTDPIVSWSVTGVSKEVEVGDGVVIWIAHRHPDQRGIYAMGKVVGEPRPGYPLDWGSPERRAEPVPCVPLSIFWYVTHNPVTVPELRPPGSQATGS